ncbi:hypothetical protein HYW82_04645 [Candidatus Peregrinibacteria bacterium]|nr:hypothetical protein [Candidatus Peregrinibacteria bacterium]
MSESTKTEQQLAAAVTDLTKEVGKLKDLEFIRVFKHPWKFMWFSFLKGLMVGFGGVLGASVLVAIFVYLLGQISVVPILGDVVQDVLTEIGLEKNLEKIPQLDTEQPIESGKQNVPDKKP